MHLQRVTVCCRVLQHTAVFDSVLQSTEVRCKQCQILLSHTHARNTLQHTVQNSTHAPHTHIWAMRAIKHIRTTHAHIQHTHTCAPSWQLTRKHTFTRTHTHAGPKRRHGSRSAQHKHNDIHTQTKTPHSPTHTAHTPERCVPNSPINRHDSKNTQNTNTDTDWHIHHKN